MRERREHEERIEGKEKTEGKGRKGWSGGGKDSKADRTCLKPSVL